MSKIKSWHRIRKKMIWPAIIFQPILLWSPVSSKSMILSHGTRQKRTINIGCGREACFVSYKKQGHQRWMQIQFSKFSARICQHRFVNGNLGNYIIRRLLYHFQYLLGQVLLRDVSRISRNLQGAQFYLDCPDWHRVFRSAQSAQKEWNYAKPLFWLFSSWFFVCWKHQELN